jgi:hypothetical protein
VLAMSSTSEAMKSRPKKQSPPFFWTMWNGRS